jgi:hypothetical protein
MLCSARVACPAGHRRERVPELQGRSGRAQRAGAACRLDHDCHVRQRREQCLARRWENARTGMRSVYSRHAPLYPSRAR